TFDANSAPRSSRHFGGPPPAEQFVSFGGFDRTGDLTLSGVASGDVDYGTGVLPGAGLTDVFVARTSASGPAPLAQRYGDAGYQLPYAFAVDPDGVAYVTGFFQGSIDFGAGPLTTSDSDLFAAAIEPSGKARWSRAFHSGPQTTAWAAIACDDSGA